MSLVRERFAEALDASSVVGVGESRVDKLIEELQKQGWMPPDRALHQALTARDVVRTQLVHRVVAWLVRNEGVSPEAVERAVTSALDMALGEVSTLALDDDAPMRRAFVFEQVGLLERKR